MALHQVRLGTLPFERFESILPPEAYHAVMTVARRAEQRLAGRVVWNVNSTSRGGGVAELLISLLAYAHAVGVDARWEVISGNREFFTLTKRIHNNLHSAPGDGGPLGDAEREVYEDGLREDTAELCELVSRGDVVIVHDPQPAGIIPALKRRRGIHVIWRCHVGIDAPTELARRAWSFLRPYVQEADAYVFSRRAFVWEGLADDKINLIAPVIDAFSAKNQELDADTVAAILAAAGLNSGAADAPPTFTTVDGAPARVNRRAEVLEESELDPDDPLVLQVSRWDRLKDPVGVIRGFAEHVAPHSDAHLVYAGPQASAVADDPEGSAVLDEARRAYEDLDAASRARVHLAEIPMQDRSENAAIINALQRRADVIVQKSLAEGFGLTVAEAMWKARPVVASRIGGIQDQIENARSGVLLDDPTDLAAFGAAVGALLRDPVRARRLGEAARERVRDEFLSMRNLTDYYVLIERMLESAPD